MARINAKLGFMTVVEKEEEENLDVNEAMMEDTIDMVSKSENRICNNSILYTYMYILHM